MFYFDPLPAEMIQFDEHIFPMGWNHQLDQFVYNLLTGRIQPTYIGLIIHWS